MLITKHLSLSFCVALLATALTAQSVNNNTNGGYPENGVFHGSDLESVQVNNGNNHIHLPTVSVKGRGLDAAAAFLYDNKGWYLRTVCDNLGTCSDAAWPETGNSMILAARGSFSYSVTNTTQNLTCQNHGVVRRSNVMLRDPEGTKHHFLPDPVDDSWQCGGLQDVVMYSDDGSGWLYNRVTGILTSK